ncbi:hypothetical protein EMCG_05698 [[Emmonsia] crescens]|uniref:Uncharacterized protein n=1 Tax=[Emmonsia] crescens TaxID=73230 RepID=A0A0G2IDM9_9EURO|nr:hypothetical protein EMCG_05698 [Emmonsia crescens UAMH 3008]
MADSNALKPFTIKAQGPHHGDSNNYEKELLAQLKDIPRDASTLLIKESSPSEAEWSLLGNLFNSVTDLEVELGWEGVLNDGGMPQHWPLKWLLFSGACGEKRMRLRRVRLVTKNISLEALEILENDAMDTFIRMHLAMGKLKTVNIRSTNGCDLQFTDEVIIPNVRTKHPLLTVGEVFSGNNHKHFQLNIYTLRFKAPSQVRPMAEMD